MKEIDRLLLQNIFMLLYINFVFSRFVTKYKNKLVPGLN